MDADEVAPQLARLAGADGAEQVVRALEREPEQVDPIVGVRNAEQLEDNLGAVDVELSAEQRALLDTAAAPQLGFPRSFLESDGVRELIYGDTWELLYSRREGARDTAPTG